MSTPRRIDSETTAESLHAAAIHLLRRLRRIDGRSGSGNPAIAIHPSRLSALSVIVFSGPITLGRLAAAEQVRPPTMTRIVHALEAEGLVRKNASAGDRRAVQISATLRGKRLLLRARGRRVRWLADRIRTLPRCDQAALRAAAGILSRLLRP